MFIPLQGVINLALLAFFHIAFSTLHVHAKGTPSLRTHVIVRTLGGKVKPDDHQKVVAGNLPRFKPGKWKKAKTTFYEGNSKSFGGACGYEDVEKQGFGEDTAALSSALFRNGESCGACYEIQCVDSKWCKKGQDSIIVSATNTGAHEHFDLPKPSFLKVAESQGGIVPVQYRRVPCQKKGGIKFTLTGNPHYNEVLVWNVAGAGDVISLQVKGDGKLKWTHMKRNWGQKCVSNANMTGQSLTFRVGTSDGKVSTSWHVCPRNWQFGHTFEGKNFR